MSSTLVIFRMDIHLIFSDTIAGRVEGADILIGYSGDARDVLSKKAGVLVVSSWLVRTNRLPVLSIKLHSC